MLRRLMDVVVAAALAAGCSEEPGEGFILDESDDQVELCVGELDVPDEALRTLLEEILPQPEPPEDAEEPPPPVILAEELRKLTGLRATELGIKDLSGLECALRLESLGLGGNMISDLSPLHSLTGVRQLELSDNQVTDLTVLQGFGLLEKVTLDGNGITDISPLARIETLEFIDLARNEITDIGPLAKLTRLTGLVLSKNMIRDLTPLRGLVELVAIKLDDNEVDSIDAFENLTKLRYVDLDANAVPSLTPLTDASDLIEVEVSSNQLTDLRGLANKPRLIEIKANENLITTTDGVQGLTGLTNLEVGSNQVSALTGVETLISLRKLQLADNLLSDINAVTGLPEVRDVDIRNNAAIVDITPVGTLPLLGRFTGGVGQTLNLAPLAGRTVLKTLSYTEATLVGDLAVLDGLPSLEALDLRNVALTPAMVQQMSVVGNLQTLRVNGCGITDLSALAPNMRMEVLEASDNLITEVSVLQFWPRAREVTLTNNPLTNLQGVELLEVLRTFDISGSQVQDLAPLAANETFRQGDEVLAAETPLDGQDCGDVQTIRGRNGVVVVDFDCP